MGYSSLATRVPGEIDTSGYQWNLKGLYSHYFDRWLFDFGGGFLLNHMNADYPAGGSRANAVAAVIRKSGIPRSKIETVGFGPDQLLNKGNTVEDHAVNRRVELHLMNIKDVETITRELQAIADR